MARSTVAPHLEVVTGGAARTESRGPTDEDIVRGFAQGDRDAVAQLYDRLVSTVDRTLYRVLGRRGDDHEDLVQSAFEQIILTLATRRYAGACTLPGWAATIACHVGLNALRARRRERRVIDRDHDGDAIQRVRGSIDVEAEVHARRQVERLRDHLAQMDELKATTLLVHDVFGHSLAEVAAMTGVSVAAAQSRLVRARKELESKLLDNSRRGGRPRP